MLFALYTVAVLGVPQCHCPPGFAFDDNTVSRTFDVTTQYGTGCHPISCTPDMCANGTVTTCTTTCKDQTACCHSCNPGYYRSHSIVNGDHVATCEPLACPSNSAPNGQTECVCAATHYRSGWQPGTGSLTEANVRTMQLTNARENTAVYDLEVCVEVQPTCIAVAHCKHGATCIGGSQPMPFTGTCNDCDDGYETVSLGSCAVDASANCTKCVPMSCPNGTIYE